MGTDIEMHHSGFDRQETIEDAKPVEEAEWMDFRRVPDKLPMVALLILVVEVHQSIVCLAENFIDVENSLVNVSHTLASVDRSRTTSSQSNPNARGTTKTNDY